MVQQKDGRTENLLSGSATHNSQRKWLFQGDRSGQQITQSAKAK
jgi:hypothetical protein